ncbi:MAG: hypothetical protein GY906_36655 [bacterium]|nr:hypothetical protein [bacterium]
MIYVVTGMHKSGTSMVSSMLHASGIHMGEFPQGSDYSNDVKHERRETNKLNENLLGIGDRLFSLHVRRGASWCDVNEEIRSALDSEVDKNNSNFAHWGFKDPRTCLTYSCWKEVLGNHKVVLVYRPPWQVWSHYQIRGWREKIEERNHLLASLWLPTITWCRYNEKVLQLAGHGDASAILISFSSLMKSGLETRRLSSFLGRELVDQRNPNLYRHRDRRGVYYTIVKHLQAALGICDVDRVWRRLLHLRDLQVQQWNEEDRAAERRVDTS